jgi:hypothetical protein
VCRWKYSISQGHRIHACPSTPTKEAEAFPPPQHVVLTSNIAAPAAKCAPPPAKRAPSLTASLPKCAPLLAKRAPLLAKRAPLLAKRAPSPQLHDCPHHTTCIPGKCAECACPACAATQAVPGQRRRAQVTASPPKRAPPPAKRAPSLTASPPKCASILAKRAPSPQLHDCPHHTTCIPGKCAECACAACRATQVAGRKRVSLGSTRYC